MITKKLTELRILANDKKKKKIVRELQRQGLLHIEHLDAPSKDFEKDKSLPGTDGISLSLLMLEYIMEETGIDTTVHIEKLPSLKEVKKQTQILIDEKYDVVKKLARRRDEEKENLQDLLSKKANLDRIPFNLEKTRSEKFENALYFGDEEVDLSKSGTKIVARKIKYKGKFYYKLTFLMKNKSLVKNHMKKKPLKEIDISYVKESSEKEKEILEKKIKESERKIERIKKELRDSVNGYQSHIAYLYLCLENHYKQHTVTNKFQVSKNHFLLKGFCEPSDVEKIKEIEDITILSENPVKAPTKLENKKMAKPFQEITELFSLPKYGAADPTFLVSLFYPLFFGLMFSDVGYGLMLLFTLIPIWYKFGEKSKPYIKILALSAISTILFGFVFGAFFGGLIPIQPLYDDSFNVSFELLILSLIIGLVHLNIGYGLKLYQSINMGNFSSKLLEVLPFLLLQVSLATLYYENWIISTAILTVTLGLLFYNKSIFGLMDISGFFGTWFSYARLLALNLATAGVALAVNTIADMVVTISVIGTVLWVLLIVIGHLFNYVINFIGISINSARLHYVEFFQQFFEVGGYKFKPFEIKTSNIET